VPTKKCSLCGYRKPLESYYTNKKSKDGLTARCADCCRLANAEYRACNVETVAKRKADYRRRNRDMLRAYYRRYDEAHREERRIKAKLYKYGLTRDEYVALLKTAGGKCQICKQKCDKLQIEHCHVSGTVRGLVCRRCNKGLAVFKDCKKTVAAAAKFLNI